MAENNKQPSFLESLSSFVLFRSNIRIVLLVLTTFVFISFLVLDVPSRIYNRIQSERLVSLAEASLEKGNTERAMQLAQTAKNRRGNAWRAYFILGRCHEQLGSPLAANFYTHAYVNSKDPAYYLDALRLNIRSRNSEEVDKLLKDPPGDTKSSVQFHLLAGEWNSLVGKAREAELHYQEAKRLGPVTSDQKILLASWQYSGGDTQQAIEVLERISQEDGPEGIKALRILVSVYLQRKREDDAVNSAQRLASHPQAEFEDKLRLLAVLSDIQNRAIDKQSRLSDRIGPSDLSNQVAWMISLPGGTASSADNLLQKILQDVPKEKYFPMADWLLLNKRYDRGLDWISSLNEEQDHLDVQLLRATFLAALNRWTELEPFLEKADWKHLNPVRKLILGQTRLALNQPVEAQLLWEDAFDTARNSTKLLELMFQQMRRMRGLAPSLAREWIPKEIETAQRIVELNPSSDKAAVSLINLYRETQDRQSLRPLLSRLADIPISSETQRTNINVQLLLFNAATQKTLESVRELFENNPDVKERRVAYAFSCFYSGHFQEAASIFDGLGELTKDDLVQAIGAIIYAAAGEVSKAEVFLNKERAASLSTEPLFSRAAHLLAFHKDAKNLNALGPELATIFEAVRLIKRGDRSPEVLRRLSQIKVDQVDVVARMALLGALHLANGDHEKAEPLLKLESTALSLGLVEQYRQIIGALTQLSGRVPDDTGSLRLFLFAFDGLRLAGGVRDSLLEDKSHLSDLILKAVEDPGVTAQAMKLADSFLRDSPFDPDLIRVASYCLYLKADSRGARLTFERLAPDLRREPENAAYYALYLADTNEDARAVEFLKAAGEADIKKGLKERLLTDTNRALKTRANLLGQVELWKYRRAIEPLIQWAQTGQILSIEDRLRVDKLVSQRGTTPLFTVIEVVSLYLDQEINMAINTLAGMDIATLDRASLRALHGALRLILDDQPGAVPLLRLSHLSEQSVLLSILRDWRDLSGKKQSESCRSAVLNALDAMDERGIEANITPAERDQFLVQSMLGSSPDYAKAEARLLRYKRAYGSTPRRQILEALVQTELRDDELRAREKLEKLELNQLEDASTQLLAAIAFSRIGMRIETNSLMARIDPRQLPQFARERYDLLQKRLNEQR